MVTPLPLDDSQIARAAEEMIAEYGSEALTKADERVKKSFSPKASILLLELGSSSVRSLKTYRSRVGKWVVTRVPSKREFFFRNEF